MTKWILKRRTQSSWTKEQKKRVIQFRLVDYHQRRYRHKHADDEMEERHLHCVAWLARKKEVFFKKNDFFPEK